MSPKLFPHITDQYGYIVFMFPNDHRPTHIHVYRGEKVARINVEAVKLLVIDQYGYRKRDLREIMRLLQPYRMEMIAIWNELHPDAVFVERTDDE
ncbi:MAG: DUF4160 domain-containing protein [bacterium]|nr:DUF4160 domain-containing protein [bacterium]